MRATGTGSPARPPERLRLAICPRPKPILQKGDKFRVANHRRPLRYIQPTLKAYGVNPDWEWIMEEVAAATDDSSDE